MDRYNEIMEKLMQFRHERDWEKFHTPKNLSMGLAIEASELMQEFLWKNDDEVSEKIKNSPESVVDEIADVAVYLMMLSHDIGINLFDAIENKMKKNAAKYPVEKCKGKAAKYTEYIN